MAWEEELGVAPACDHPARSLIAADSEKEGGESRDQIGVRLLCTTKEMSRVIPFHPQVTASPK